MLEVTPQAADQLHRMLEEKKAPSGTGLRLMVERGGCAGLQYAMTLGVEGPGDGVVEMNGVKFIVDAGSLDYIKGSKVDFEDSLNDSGFKIHNPNAARSCGCGTSFEPAAGADGEAQASEAVPDGEECGRSA